MSNTLPSSTITVRVNDVEQACSAGETLQGLLETLELRTTTGIAVAVNSQVVRREDWPSHQLKSDDSVLLITATQGG